MPKILIDNRQRKKRLDQAGISSTTSRILNLLGERKSELSLVFINNSAIAALNRKYLSSPVGVTDVLAFPMRSDKDPCPVRNSISNVVLGDVVISIEKALSQAREQGEPFENELTRLIIHGILHLIGYKDKQKKDKIKMFTMQEKILSDLYEAA